MRTGLMAAAFAEAGWEVEWWTSDFDHYGSSVRGHGTSRLTVRKGYRVQYLENQGYSSSKSLKRLRSDAKVARDFARVARERSKRPDVIIASMPSVDLALESVRFGAEHAIPVIIDVRDLHPDVFVDMAPPLFRPAADLAASGMRRRVNRALAGASAIWGNTDGFVEWGCRGAGRIRSEHDRTFPIAYEPVALTQAELSEAHGKWDAKGLFLSEDINVVFFGTLSKSFDFKPIFEAARQLEASSSRHRFYFFGHGALEQQISEHCAACPNSHYLGWAPAKELQTAMERSHIGLAPYLPIRNYIENLPNKSTEYMSGGLAVATSLDRGCLVDILQETKAGFSYASGDELAQKLTHLSDTPQALEDMRAASRGAFAAKFDRQAQARGMMGAIKALIEDYRGRSRERRGL